MGPPPAVGGDIDCDGIPDDTCPAGSMPNTLENAIAVAAAAKSGNPSIATFVIGVGSELTALNAISQAGGTGDAILVDTGAGIVEPQQEPPVKASITVPGRALLLLDKGRH